MIKINGWSLLNIAHHKDSSVIVQPGLNVIRGLNKSSNNKSQNNGSGKSLLCSPIPNILLGSPPVISKKKGKNDLLNKDSCATLDFTTHDKRRIIINQYSSRYDISENRKDLSIATQSKAQEQIKEYFPLNTLEFYSTFYLTSMPHPFQVASPVERLKFISDLFRLHEYDIMKKHFSVQLKTIKDSETEHRALLTEYIKLEQRLLVVNWSKKKEAKLEQKAEELSKLSKRIATLQEKSLTFSKMSVVKQQLNTLHSKLNSYGKYKDPKATLAKLCAIEISCKEYETFCREYQTYQRNVSGIKEALANIDCSVSAEEAKQNLQKATKRFQKSYTEHAELYKLEEAYVQKKEYKSILKTKLSELNVDIGDYSIESIQQKKYEARAMLELEPLLDCGGDSKCPTCKSTIDIDSIKKKVRQSKANLVKYDTIQKALKLTDEYESVVIPDFDADMLKTLSAKLEQHREELLNCESVYKDAKQKEALLETLGSITKPEPVDEPDYDYEDIVKKIKDCESYSRVSKELQVFLSEHAFDDSYTDEAYEECKSSYKEVGKRINAIHEDIKRYENEKSEYVILSRTRDGIQAKLNDLSSTIEEKKIISTLVDAYGPKGIKINAINNICKSLESNFNSMASFVFNEDFEFEVNVDTSGIDVIVHRKKSTMSDIKMLSGAESDCFRLLFLTSLLPMMPQDRRVDTLILDEPSSHMDPVSKEKFINSFVPYITSIVPSVYILDPHSDYYPDANNMLVTKYNGVSKLTQDTRQYG